jgi:hypothetical protein
MVEMQVTVFWVMMPCGVAVGYHLEGLGHISHPSLFPFSKA